MSGPCVNDTSTVELSNVGGALSADLVVSPDPGNMVSARPNGVFVDSGGDFTGKIITIGGATAPPGYLVCDGSLVSRAVYSDLFAVIGTRYGAGDGSTTFKLPGPWFGDREFDRALRVAQDLNWANPPVADETTALLVIDGNSVFYTGSEVRITVSIPRSSTSGTEITTLVKRDGVSLGQVTYRSNISFFGPASEQGFLYEWFDTPPAGNHKYSAYVFGGDSGGTNDIYANTGGPNVRAPAVLRVVGSNTHLIKT